MVESGANEVATLPDGPFAWITLGFDPSVYPMSVIAFALSQSMSLPHFADG